MTTGKHKVNDIKKGGKTINNVRIYARKIIINVRKQNTVFLEDVSDRTDTVLQQTTYLAEGLNLKLR